MSDQGDAVVVSATTVLAVMTDALELIKRDAGDTAMLGYYARDIGTALHVTAPDGRPVIDRREAEERALKAYGITKRSTKRERADALAEYREGIASGERSPLPFKVGPKPSIVDRELDSLVARYDREEAARDVIRRRKLGQRPSMASKVLTATELAAQPGLEPLVDGILFRGTIAMLFGLPGSYKSFLAIALAGCIATGSKFLGRSVAQGPTLYVAAEGAAGLGKRVEAWGFAWHNGAPVEGMSILPEAVNLSDDSEVDELAELNRQNGYALIVIDTWARSLGGADENSASATSLLVENVERVKRAHPGTSVLIIHHRGKTGNDPRGSIALLGAVDTALAISGERAALTLEAVKQKDIEGGVVETLEAVSTADSLILRRRAGGHSTPDELPERFAETLAHFTRAFSATGATKTEFRDLLIDAGYSRTSAYTHIDRLVNDKSLLWERNKLSLAQTTPLDPFDSPTPGKASS